MTRARIPCGHRLAMVLAAGLLGATAPAALAAPDYDGDGAIADDCRPLDPAVHPGAADRPDLAFEDTNCDGIDGDEAKAVFVSVSGNDAGSGTRTNPRLTLASAIQKARAEAKDVYVMGGTYDGTVILRTDVGIYGGYAPVTAARSSTESTVISGAPEGALADAATGVVLQLLTLQATGGHSTYGLRAVNGSRVLLQDVTVTAGGASGGQFGFTFASYTNGRVGEPGTNGFCTSSITGGAGIGGLGGGKIFSDGPGYNGGNGGSGATYSADPQSGDGGAGPNGVGVPPAGAGGVRVLFDVDGRTGDKGFDASASPGVIGASGSHGTFPVATTALAWFGAPGGSGGAGTHGAAGGGGAGGSYEFDNTEPRVGNGGGGGGGGGEGGGGGTPGDGGSPGGGSFGVFAHNSQVVVEGSSLTTGNGGEGGHGDEGGPGGAGGAGGPGGPGSNCPQNDGGTTIGGAGGPGGRGQQGGSGGRGGGGTGGPSIGIYVAGSGLELARFVEKSTTITVGAPGLGGVGRNDGSRADSGVAMPTAGGAEATDTDFDGDGVADPADACTATAAATGDGCPARPAALTDGDGDGVPDAVDACPASAAGANDADGDGCADGSSTPPGTTPPGTTPPPTDADGDGSPLGVDCVDTNPGIRPGVTDVPNNGVDEDCAGGDAIGQITARVTHNWSAKRAFTTLLGLSVGPLPAGARVELRCKGKGCPFKVKRQTFAAAVRNASLERLVNRVRRVRGKRRKVPARLRVRTKLEVRVTAPGLIGRSVVFTIRKNRIPATRAGCLAPGTGAAMACPLP